MQGPDDLVVVAPQLDLFGEDLFPDSDHAFDRPFGHGEARRPLAPETLGLSEMVQARKEPVDVAKSQEEANEELTAEDQQHDELTKWQLPCWLPAKTKELLAVQAIPDAIHDIWDRRKRSERPARTKELTTKSEPSADQTLRSRQLEQEEYDHRNVESSKTKPKDEEKQQLHTVKHQNQRKSERGGLHHAARHSQQKKQVDVLEDDGSELASDVY